MGVYVLICRKVVISDKALRSYSSAAMKPIRVGLVGYEDVQALDLIGPADAFTIAEIEDEHGKRQRCYEVVVLAASKKPFTSEAGIYLEAQATFRNAPTLDTLII